MVEERNIAADYEEVLRVLSESFQDAWRDNPDVLVYLSELGSFGLHRLTQEPDRLAEERASVLEQTQDLAFHNYKTFIQAAECSQKIFEDFSIIETRLESLLNKLPAFKVKCGTFGKDAQQINSRWKQASSTLAKHQQLLEILEMPQLMDNYVKAVHYDEALELAAYVKRLERKHTDIPLIRSIISDIQASTNLMLTQLLSKLQTNIQLPECLKIVGYLRRMDVFNETELRIKFLQGRDTWFQKVITEFDKTDPYQHVIKVIENSRIHLFDIITQYRAIFSDDDPFVLVNDSTKGNCAVFHSWMTMKILWFLNILKEDITSNLGGRIDSVFAQCMYFGLSFSRVNIDFRPLLIPIFQHVMFSKFKSEVEVSTQKFSKTMIGFVFSSYYSTAIVMPNLSEDSLQPPCSLLDFHPLAQYCNDILTALNDLKLCCSFSLASEVTRLIYESLGTVIKVLTGIFYQKKNIMNDEAKDHFYRFCLSLSSDLVPHLNKCLIILFPPEEIFQLLGISSMELKKIDFLCRLDLQVIMKPLEDILPSKEDDDGIVLNINPNDNEQTSVIKEDTKKEPDEDGQSTNREADSSQNESNKIFERSPSTESQAFNKGIEQNNPLNNKISIENESLSDLKTTKRVLNDVNTSSNIASELTLSTELSFSIEETE